MEDGAEEGDDGGGVDPGVEGVRIVSGDCGFPSDILVEGIDGRASI